VEQEALVAGRDPEHRARVLAGEALDVAQGDDLALTVGEVVERRAQQRCQGGGVDPAVGLVGPRRHGLAPGAAAVEPSGVHGVLDDVDGGAGALPGPGRSGPVDEDAEQPRLERRPPLEAIDAPDHAHPRVLDHLLGDGLGGHDRAGDAQHGALVPGDEGHEGVLVPVAQATKQLHVGLHRHAA